MNKVTETATPSEMIEETEKSKVMEKYRIKLNAEKGKVLAREIAKRVKKSLKSARNDKSLPEAHRIDERTTTFKMSKDSHIFQLFLVELHKQLLVLWENGTVVNPIAIMLTDPRLSSIAANILREKILGETAEEHEFWHARTLEDLGYEEGYFIVTPVFNSNNCDVEIYTHFSVNGMGFLDNAKIASAPRIPGSGDIQVVKMLVRALFDEGREEEAILASLPILGISHLDTVDANEKVIQMALFNEYQKNYPLPLLAGRKVIIA